MTKTIKPSDIIWAHTYNGLDIMPVWKIAKALWFLLSSN